MSTIIKGGFMPKTSFVLLSMFVLWIIPLQLEGQITITSSDIQKPVGYQFSVESSAYGSYPVDLGSTGGPQNWDFTSYSTPDVVDQEVVDSGSTPFGSNFPTSNFCIMVTEGLSEEFFEYNRIESNSWTFQGIGVETPDTSFYQIWNPMAQIPLPVTMGSSWVWEMGWEYEFLGITTILEEREHATVDAYGTMTIPAGSFEVLRIMAYDTTIVTTDFGPFQFADTTTVIDYAWISTDPVFVASATSDEGETNPNFTTAAYISRAGSSTGVGDGGGGEVKVPLAFRLEQNVPNPFNPQTNITFTVSGDTERDIELSVFTIRGSKVKTLVSGKRSPGEYVISWDGRDDSGESLPSGVYFYRLTTEGESITRKMVLAK
jgi:hypothetical protein